MWCLLRPARRIRTSFRVCRRRAVSGAGNGLFEGTRFALEVKSAPWARAAAGRKWRGGSLSDLSLSKTSDLCLIPTVPLFVEDIGLLYLPTNPNAAVL